ncbi:MAG: cyclic nucleotide-binding domain-containing protein [Betaproteobacteria bacterium]|nr:cyclic nucleotide-binding domain-containing protein [Betaproteobacteria bacterium]
MPAGIAGDLWGGIAAMLVALPSAIAFGVTIYAAVGGTYAAYGAMAGILGATALGLIAPALGGTPRLITAPCAPAAAVLSAYAIEQVRAGTPAESVLFLLVAVGLLAGLLQIAYGAVGLGRLIKYMPYPVVSGYLSGVGLIILASQLPKLLGTPKDLKLWQAFAAPADWAWQGVAVGLVTMAAMLVAPRLTKRVPAAILALAAGMATYVTLAAFDPALRSLAGNRLVIGPLGGGGGFMEAFSGRLNAFGATGLEQVAALLVPALTLSVLLSIDTLKTCVVLDALTRTRHDSNRELIGQGMGNLVAGLVGGIPGAGTMGATLVNLSSGGASRLSGIIEGGAALVAFLVLGGLIAWVPVGALAAILIVIGARMIDRHSFALLKSRHTVVDFAVIIAVVATALFVGLIPASGVGIVLAIFLFVREQVGTSILRRKLYGNQTFSKHVRSNEEMEVLVRNGDQAVIFELQGSLFFGTTAQLYTLLEPELKTRRFIVLDMRRVQTVDVTAAHLLDQVRDMLAERGAFLVYANLPRELPSGRDLQSYIDNLGLAPYKSAARVFDDIDDAKAWIEGRLLREADLAPDDPAPLEIGDIDMLRGRKDETIAELNAITTRIDFKAGERIFARGDPGDELYIVRRGTVRLVFPLGDKTSRHLASCGRGALFGEMAFLDGAPRSADAIAETDVELFCLSRRTFDGFAEHHRKAAAGFFEGLASVLTARLRYTTAEVAADRF